MISRVQKWGNSLAVRIPRGFASDTGLVEGSEVDLKLEDGDIRIRRVPPRKYRLEELLADIRADNIHGEVDAGESVGREVW